MYSNAAVPTTSTMVRSPLRRNRLFKGEVPPGWGTRHAGTAGTPILAPDPRAPIRAWLTTSAACATTHDRWLMVSPAERRVGPESSSRYA